MRIHPGTSSHSALTLSERGFKRLDSYGTYGDHFVHLKIKVPSILNAEQKELIKEFAYLETDTPGTISGIDRSRPRPTNQHTQSESTRYQSAAGGSAEYEHSAYSDKSSGSTDYNTKQRDSDHNEEGFFAKLKRKLLG